MTDQRRANDAFAEQQGMLKKNGKPHRGKAEEYIRENDLTWHHAPGTSKMQALPKPLHENVKHSGGASQARKDLGTTR